MNSDPVHLNVSGKWCFWDETWTEEIGSYDTEGEARTALGKYAEYLNGPTKITLVARGYEWICPACGEHNTQPEATDHVTCLNCNCARVYKTSDDSPLHVFPHDNG